MPEARFIISALLLVAIAAGGAADRHTGLLQGKNVALDRAGGDLVELR